MVVHREKFHTISIRGLGLLTIDNVESARRLEHKIDKCINEFDNGNYDNIDDFCSLVEKLIDNILESIKLYAQRDENQKLDLMRKYVTDFFTYHVFDNQDDMQKIKEGYDRALSKLIAKLHTEKRDSRKLVSGKRSMHVMLKTLFRNNNSLDRILIRSAKKEICLADERERVRRDINKLLRLLSARNSSVTKSQKKAYDKQLIAHLLELSKVMFREFSIIHDIQTNINAKEGCILIKIDEHISKSNKDVKDKLEKLRSTITQHLQTNFFVAKRIYAKTAATQQEFDGTIDKLIQHTSESINYYVTKYPQLFRFHVDSECDIDKLFCRVSYAYGKETGAKIYLKGGYVRDKIIGVESKDIDVNMVGRLDEFVDLFIYMVHATSGVMLKRPHIRQGQHYLQIACGDLKPDGFDVNMVEDIRSSLYENCAGLLDFTMNALAIDVTCDISVDDYLRFESALMKKKLDETYYEYLIYPDPSFLQDAVHKVFRIPYLSQAAKGPKLAGRLSKFYERFHSDVPQGFSVDPQTWDFLFVNSARFRVGISGRYTRHKTAVSLRKIFNFDEQNCNNLETMRITRNTASILAAIHCLRKRDQLEDNIVLQIKNIVLCDGTITDKEIMDVYDFSFYPIRNAIESFVFDESTNKNYKLFLKWVSDAKSWSFQDLDGNLISGQKVKDYFGESNIKSIFNGRSEDKFLHYSMTVDANYGKSLNYFMSALSGTAKWIKNFDGDEDTRIYNCLNNLQGRGNVVTSFIRSFNIKNLEFLKVSGYEKSERKLIRMACLLADLKVNIPVAAPLFKYKRFQRPKNAKRPWLDTDIEEIFYKLSMRSPPFKGATPKIRLILYCVKLLLSLRFIVGNTSDEEKEFVRIITIAIHNYMKINGKVNLLTSLKNNIKYAHLVIIACSKLKGTKYFNPIFNVKEEQMSILLKHTLKTVEDVIEDASVMNRLNGTLCKLNNKQWNALGILGPDRKKVNDDLMVQQINGDVSTSTEAEMFINQWKEWKIAKKRMEEKWREDPREVIKNWKQWSNNQAA